jgi:hypothetical protein
MHKFAKVAAEFDCVLRGDHSFGFGSSSNSLFDSAFELQMNFKDSIDWGLQPEYQNRIDTEAAFAKHEHASLQLKGEAIHAWRHRSRRLTRNPRAHLPMGQLQAQYMMVGYPLMSRTIVSRMARSEIRMKNDKQIAIEALAFASPPDISRIPHSYAYTWSSSEPLLCLPHDILGQMAEVIQRPGILSEIVNERGVVEMFWSSLSSARGGNGKPALKTMTTNVKRTLKKLLPSRVVQKYRVVSAPRTPIHMLFKRLFAAKVFIDGAA